MLTIEEIQNVELGIMKAFHDFCVKHNLKYSLAYGTLLGAVRHKGFIPWDNDVDIFMKRPDYEKFLELVSKESFGEHFYFINYKTDKKYHYIHTRLCDDRTIADVPYICEQPKRMGVWVDIFPVDGYPKSILRRLRLYFNLTVLIADIWTVKGRKDWGNRLGQLCNIIFPNKLKRAYLIDELCQKASYEKSDFACGSIVREERNRKYDKSVFEDLILLPFCDTEFYCSRDYDKLLRDCYGNYMELPPVDQRVPHPINIDWVK